MIHALCNSCLQPYQILLEASDLPLVKQISDEKGHTCPCPRLCGGRINLVGSPTIRGLSQKLKPPMSLRGIELYQAVNGLGLKDEIPNNPETVRAMLVANKVVEAKVEEDDGRIYLRTLTLDNGLTLHLTSGLQGATVLKITKG